MRRIPRSFPSGIRRFIPSRLKRVQLITADGPEEHTGFFRVPAEAVTFKEHSNEILKFDKIVTEKVRLWTAWKAARGWARVDKPVIHAPVPSPRPSPNEDPVDGDNLRVYVVAHFRRIVPVYASSDDVHAQLQDAKRYGIDVSEPLRSTNSLPATFDSLTADEHRRPMEEAEKRREALGLKRKLVTKRDKHGDLVVEEATVEPK